MKKRTFGTPLAARAAALTLAGALLAGCSANSRLLPAAPGTAPGPSLGRAVDAFAPDRSGGSVRVLMQIQIPRRTGRRFGMHPSTISPLTHSVSIAVNAAKAQVFNTTSTSPDCTTTTTGTTCTFAVGAPAGTDTFTVTTYSGVNATGTALDRGIALKVPILTGKANHVAIKLGPLVTTVADTGTGSLRYAVQTASSGDTITFSLPAKATITLASPIVVVGTLTIAGPGATDLTVSGGGTHQLFRIQGNATITGLTLTKGKAATPGQPGGAIFNTGVLALASDAVGGNTSTVAFRRVPVKFHSLRMRGLHPHCSTTPAEGGAIFNAGTLTMSGTTFTGNKISDDSVTCIVGEGGAIYNSPLGNLSSTGDTYDANAAGEGGAVYTASLGTVNFTNDSFTSNTGCTATNGCPTSGCNATSCTSRAAGEGAAIYDGGVGMTVTGTKFTGNVAGGKTAGSIGEGGAIYLDSVIPTISHSTFTGNLAGGGTTSCSTGTGGAIYAVNAVELDSDAFDANTATGDQIGAGGAIVAAAGASGTNDTFSGNKATGTGGPCTTSAGGIGGAMYSGGIITLTNTAFTSNGAIGASTGQGGAIAAPGVALTDCAFTSNTATGTGTAGATESAGEGGALATEGSAIKGTTFTGNTATAEGSVAFAAFGGAVLIESTGTLVSTGNTFTSNVASDKAGTGIAAGGAMALASSSVTLNSTRDTFSKNSASVALGTAVGGGVYAAGGATMFNTTMTSNTVSGKESTAGALGLSGTGSTLFHLVMTGNSATGTELGVGGALVDSAGSTIYESTISGNTASSGAGGVLVETNPEAQVETTVSNNVVNKANAALLGGGGGIANAGGLTLDGSTVSGNSVTGSGAGPIGGGGVLNADPLTMTSSTISGNKVLGAITQGGGGGIYSVSSITATNSTISNNSSSVTGGGIANTSTGSGTLYNVTLFKNAATKGGGNIYNDGSSFTLTQSVVGGGTGLPGADIDNPGTVTSGDYNIMQTAAAGTAISTMSHDLITDPKLLPLADNGGPTLTNADTSTSPGKTHIPYSSSSCGSVSMTTDQRGFTRGAGGHCDSGAYEYAGVVSAIKHRPMHRVPAAGHTGKTPVPLPHLTVTKIHVDI